MKTFLKRYWFLILLATLAFSLLAAKILFFNLPKVVSIDPLSKATIEPDIKAITVYFDTEVSEILPNLKVKASPEIPFDLSGEEKKLFIRPLQELQKDIFYSWEIKYQDRLLFQWVYDVKAVVTPAPKEIGDPNFREEIIIKKTLSDYPLVRFVPFANDRFYINYSAPRKLIVKIKSGDFEIVRKEALDWISAKGIDPKTHEIEWIE